jgi:hypothetical protein
VDRAKWPDDSPLVVRQLRHIGPSLPDDITLENFSRGTRGLHHRAVVDATWR